MQPQQKLQMIREQLETENLKHPFQSYIEYRIGKKVADFNEDDMKIAANLLVSIIERGSQNVHSIEESLVINQGAKVLALCAFDKQFENSLRHVPHGHYWAILFCLELIEGLTWNFIKAPEGFITESGGENKYCHVPTGEFIEYKEVTIYSGAQNRNIRACKIIDIKQEV